MKPRSRSWLLPFVLVAFFSCSKELSKENGTAPVNGDFYATVDGNLWNADSLQLVIASNGGVSINGLSKTGDQISMILPTFKTGTYTLNASSDSYAYFTNILATTPVGYLSNSGSAGGTVTITAIDTVNHFISGSFAFTLINPLDNSSKSVTQGVFDYVPYSTNGVIVTPPPTGTGLDTLKAVIGAVQFDAALIQVQPAGGQLVIAGISNDGTQNLDILFPTDVTPGTYQLDYSLGMYGAIYFLTNNVSNPLVSKANGTLTITSNDPVSKRVKGTFTFTATSLDDTQTVNITSGYFSVNY